MPGYIIMTCHEGTDWAVYDFDPKRDEEDERFDSKEEAMIVAQKTVDRFNASRPWGVLGCRLFDFTSEEA